MESLLKQFIVFPKENYLRNFMYFVFFSHGTLHSVFLKEIFVMYFQNQIYQFICENLTVKMKKLKSEVQCKSTVSILRLKEDLPLIKLPLSKGTGKTVLTILTLDM